MIKTTFLLLKVTWVILRQNYKWASSKNYLAAPHQKKNRILYSSTLTLTWKKVFKSKTKQWGSTLQIITLIKINSSMWWYSAKKQEKFSWKENSTSSKGLAKVCNHHLNNASATSLWVMVQRGAQFRK